MPGAPHALADSGPGCSIGIARRHSCHACHAGAERSRAPLQPTTQAAAHARGSAGVPEKLSGPRRLVGEDLTLERGAADGLSQGAKPGKGGILPAAKITPEIAEIRGIPVGVDSISPNRHPDVGTTAELLDLIERVRRVAAYVQNLSKEVGIIAHSCGVRSPRELRRFHAHLVQADGRTIGLDQFYPESERQIVAALSWPQTWSRDQIDVVHASEHRSRPSPLEPPRESSLEPVVAARKSTPSLHAPTK
jgi:hypothetical protein